MINPKRFVDLTRKWQKMASAKRRRISYPRSFVADKGHFVVYTTDEKRFMVPLEFLTQIVFKELLRLSEEEFGLPSHGAIILPCDSTFLEYVISLVQGRIPEELEKALLTSIATCHHLASSSLAPGQSQQTLIFGY
ncbi:auxin-responsive protein SAUR62-like [Mangifera indica]|uniref:auxin-responsive protein SAUR62-like n=1 Tax=Mangifera indica TaxID=29780 RepID=UPI001CF9A05F|nr:auxin-responsive protein SAUR62-like [Mangifera indica]